MLGAVVLVVTGGEALYADMGHFGKRPIRLAWFAVVLPALVLNYFGQGALLLDHPEAARNPFYSLVPELGAVPDGGDRDGGGGGGVAGADLGGVLAHPAGGAAGLLPAGHDRAHLADRDGQIYIPEVNRLLGVGLRAAGARRSSRRATWRRRTASRSPAR